MGEPVAHGVFDVVAVAGLQARLQVVDGPDQPLLYRLLGAAFLLDPPLLIRSCDYGA